MPPMSSLTSNLLKLNYFYRYLFKTPIRQLNLHEYQSKELLRKFGCTVQNFIVIEKDMDLVKFDNCEIGAKGDGAYMYVVKAQILAGGRGKGRLIKSRFDTSGVFMTMCRDKVRLTTLDMLGKKLVTKQTGPDGVLVKRVMIAEAVMLKHETYLSILMDPSSGGPIVVACRKGGMDIEEVAKKEPELILKEPISIVEGITCEQCLKIAVWLHFDNAKSIVDAAYEINKLYDCFINLDATQIEINPFGQVHGGEVYCVDAKIVFDDNAAFRQKSIFESALDEEEMSKSEMLAKKFGLSYIPMDGNIACMVNGAGLAMATMDIIHLYGGVPANFLDVGGSATVEQVKNAFKIVASSNPKIKAIFVNIFAGILRCDIIAEGVIAACKELESNIPVVLRLKGTNVDKAKSMLENASQLKGKFELIESFEDAAKRVVELSGGGSNNEKYIFKPEDEGCVPKDFVW